MTMTADLKLKKVTFTSKRIILTKEHNEIVKKLEQAGFKIVYVIK